MTTAAAKQTRGYTDIGGHQTWFADAGGTRDPLLILHGGLIGGYFLLWGEESPSAETAARSARRGFRRGDQAPVQIFAGKGQTSPDVAVEQGART